MRFSNKTRFLIYITVLIFSTYIGYLLGNAFCIADSKPNCLTDVLIYISMVCLSSLLGPSVFVNLSEKSLTDWNQDLEEE